MREHGIAQWGRYRKSCISSKLALVGQFWRSTWRNAPRDIIFVFIPIVIGAGGLIKNEGPPAAKAQGLVHYLHMYTEKDHSCVHVWTCFRAGGLDGNLHDGEQAACWSPCLRPRVVFVRGASALLVYEAVEKMNLAQLLPAKVKPRRWASPPQSSHGATAERLPSCVCVLLVRWTPVSLSCSVRREHLFAV